MKILVLVVLYKCDIEKSATLNSIQLQDLSTAEYSLVIWDNGPVPQTPNFSILKNKLHKVDYISKPENVWLSKVYNQVLGTNEFDYVILLDQDSNLPLNFFSTLTDNIKLHPSVNLFLPIVKNEERIVSPGSFWYFKGKHWQKEVTGLVSSKNLLAITSGMTVSSTYFKKSQYKFDERLSLYGIDSKFILDYAKTETNVFVLPVTFIHSSALWSESDADSYLPRFRNFRKAWSIMLSDRPAAHLLTNIHTTYVSIKLALKYKDLRFLKK